MFWVMSEWLGLGLAGADPGFSEGRVGGWGGGLTNVRLHHFTVIVIKQLLFHKKKYGQNICIC